MSTFGKAYPPAWARARAVRTRTARWQRQGLVSAEQLGTIEAAYPLDYYRPVWPLRLVLFFFTWLGIGLGGSFVFLSVAELSPLLGGVLMTLGCLGLAELVVKEKRAYYAGPDNALLYCGLGAAVGALWYGLHTFSALSLNLIGPASPVMLLALVLTLALLLAAVARYAEPLVTAAAYATAAVLLLDLLLITAWGLLVLPFALMGFGAAAHALHQRLHTRIDADYYELALLVLKVLALSTVYLSGNYLVVREASASLHNLLISEQIALAPLFYGFTAGIPLLYLALGLRRHDRIFLLLGLLALAFSLFTLRHYRALLPPEWAATLGGFLLVAGTGAALRYLRPQRHGLTSAPDGEPRFVDLETLVTVETANTTTGPAAPGFEFGGGQSGGGGATGQF